MAPMKPIYTDTKSVKTGFISVIRVLFEYSGTHPYYEFRLQHQSQQ
jgi:hypothetical protein